MIGIDIVGSFPFDFLPFDIEKIEFLRQFFRIVRIADQQQFDAFDRIGDSAQAIQAGRDFGGDIDRGDFSGMDVADLKQLGQSDAFHAAHLLEAVADENAVFSFEGAHVGDRSRDATRSR